MAYLVWKKQCKNDLLFHLTLSTRWTAVLTASKHLDLFLQRQSTHTRWAALLSGPLPEGYLAAMITLCYHQLGTIFDIVSDNVSSNLMDLKGNRTFIT